jgi:hypothetical protein
MRAGGLGLAPPWRTVLGCVSYVMYGAVRNSEVWAQLRPPLWEFPGGSVGHSALCFVVGTATGDLDGAVRLLLSYIYNDFRDRRTPGMADHPGCVTVNHVIDAAWLATRGPGLTTVPYPPPPDLVARRPVNGPTHLLRQPLWGIPEVVNHSVADVWWGVPHDWMDLIGPDSLALGSNEASRPGDELHEGAGGVDVTDLWATVSFSRSGTILTALSTAHR